MKGLLCKEHSMPRVAHAHKRGVLRQSIEYVVREHPLNLSRLPRSTLPPKLVLATLHEKPERHSCLASSRRPARPGRAGSTMTEQNQKQKHSCFRSRFRCRRFAGSTPYCREMGCSDLGGSLPYRAGRPFFVRGWRQFIPAIIPFSFFLYTVCHTE